MTDILAGSRLISTILRHDAKQTSYKIALIRALNDVALAYPLNPSPGTGVAIPLRVLAEYWIAYYFPFVDPNRPILQKVRSRRSDGLGQDMSFRPALTTLRVRWEQFIGIPALPADGFLLTDTLRRPHLRATMSPVLQDAYDRALGEIVRTLEMPIRYAGPRGSEWSVFARPQRWREVVSQVIPLPGTLPQDKCLLVAGDLWQSFVALSLWIEALCLHEWALFTERIVQPEGRPLGRGVVYELLTARPDNRRPLTWERNQVDLLLMEGAIFHCPWTHKVIAVHSAYDLDHLLPLAIYPVNELWNLVPADREANQHLKRDRLPSQTRLLAAQGIFQETYGLYLHAPATSSVLRADSRLRFGVEETGHDAFAGRLAGAVTGLMERVREARNLATF
jgi:hypothetical protein